MSWAEVKKINSDLSMPLNEFIESKMRYISTNNVISVVASNAAVISSKEEIFLTKTMKYPGVLGINAAKKSYFAMKLFVYKNDTKILTLESGNNEITINGHFEFNKNDVIKITAQSVSDPGIVSYINLLGMVAFGDF